MRHRWIVLWLTNTIIAGAFVVHPAWDLPLPPGFRLSTLFTAFITGMAIGNLTCLLGRGTPT
jgi:hypothetical protein